MSKPKTNRVVSEEAIVLAKATIHAADKLKVSQKLASTIGLSQSNVSRMRKGSFALERTSGKAFRTGGAFCPALFGSDFRW
jgi:hypothetical protein